MSCDNHPDQDDSDPEHTPVEKLVYPVLFMELHAGDIGHTIWGQDGEPQPGFRFRVDDLYGQHYFFHSEEAAEAFLEREHMYSVTIAAMNRHRKKARVRVIPYTPEQFYADLWPTKDELSA